MIHAGARTVSYALNILRIEPERCPEFFRKLGPALEVGRSFIVAEYQRKFASLLLLWKGIGHYVSQHPENAGFVWTRQCQQRLQLCLTPTHGGLLSVSSE